MASCWTVLLTLSPTVSLLQDEFCQSSPGHSSVWPAFLRGVCPCPRCTGCLSKAGVVHPRAEDLWCQTSPMVLLRDTTCPAEMGHLQDQWTGKSLQYWEGVLLLDISKFVSPQRVSGPSVLFTCFFFTCLQFPFLHVTEELTQSNDFPTSGKMQRSSADSAVAPGRCCCSLMPGAHCWGSGHEWSLPSRVTYVNPYPRQMRPK